jgi:hypothetical protein
MQQAVFRRCSMGARRVAIPDYFPIGCIPCYLISADSATSQVINAV